MSDLNISVKIRNSSRVYLDEGSLVQVFKNGQELFKHLVKVFEVKAIIISTAPVPKPEGNREYEEDCLCYRIVLELATANGRLEQGFNVVFGRASYTSFLDGAEKTRPIGWRYEPPLNREDLYFEFDRHLRLVLFGIEHLLNEMSQVHILVSNWLQEASSTLKMSNTEYYQSVVVREGK